MPSTTCPSDVPVSRARLRLLGVAAMLGVLAALLPPAAAREPCLPECDPMNRTSDACCPVCTDQACSDFRDCQDDARLFIEDCVETRCKRGTAGRCTITLDCVQGCRAGADDCSTRLKRSIQSDCGDCRIGKGAARRTCNFCTGGDKPAPACAGAGGEGEGSSCQRQCVRRQPRIVDCYQKCQSRCEGDRCAIPICERACRDAVCRSLGKRCSPDNPNTDVRYLKCCQNGECDGDGPDTIACETTTSTTSSTSTTKTTSTTTRTTSTTSTLP